MFEQILGKEVRAAGTKLRRQFDMDGLANYGIAAKYIRRNTLSLLRPTRAKVNREIKSVEVN